MSSLSIKAESSSADSISTMSSPSNRDRARPVLIVKLKTPSLFSIDVNPDALLVEPQRRLSASEDPPRKRQRCTKAPIWPGTLPYNSFDPSGPSFCLPIMSYSDKLNSPIITFIVGHDKTPLRAHKAMLTEAAAHFVAMFGRELQEPVESTIELLEDDVGTWGLLIEWCYKGDLPALEKPNPDIVRYDRDNVLATRLKLCCLAENYNMKLLFNITMDSILWYLRHGDPGPKVEWKLFKEWANYVHENTPDVSEAWDFMSRWYVYATSYSKAESIGSTMEYDMSDLVELGHALRGLLQVSLEIIRSQSSKGSTDKAKHPPWEKSPCHSHLHTDNAASNAHITTIECPWDISLNDLRWEENKSGKIAYFLQASTLKGHPVCYVSQVARDLGISVADTRKGVERLIKHKIAIWDVEHEIFTLVALELEESLALDQH